jgi:hypothetical protein
MIDSEFIQAYLDGELSEVQRLELSHWLLAAPENRNLFRREVRLASALENAPTIAQHTKRSSVRLQAQSSQRLKKSRRLRAVRSQGFAARLFILGATAAALVIGTTFMLQEQASPAKPSDTVPEPLAQKLPPNKLISSDLIMGQALGPVVVVRDNEIMQPLPTTMKVGDQVRVGDDASVLLTMDDKRTQIRAESNSDFVIGSIKEMQARKGTQFIMSRGTLLIEAAPQPAQAPLRFLSTRSQAEVVGTILSFSVLPELDRVSVGHGVVNYSLLQQNNQKSKSTQLTAGRFGESNGNNLANRALSHTPPTARTNVRIKNIKLIDRETNAVIPGYSALESGMIIDMGKISSRMLSFRADIDWGAHEPKSVHFHHNDKSPIIQTRQPISLYIDRPPFRQSPDRLMVTNDVHALVITPYSLTPGRHGSKDEDPGKPGQSLTLIFTIINAALK